MPKAGATAVFLVVYPHLFLKFNWTVNFLSCARFSVLFVLYWEGEAQEPDFEEQGGVQGTRMQCFCAIFLLSRVRAVHYLHVERVCSSSSWVVKIVLEMLCGM